MLKSSSREFLVKEKKSIIREWPNTYTFTKFLTEHLLVARRGQVPLIICRPSIIAASIAEPVPGWTDSISAATAVFLSISLGIIGPLPGSIWNVADVIPVDLCANMILLAAGSAVVNNLHSNGQVPIVHCGTSSSNQPMTWFASADTVTDIFSEHPLPNQLMVRQVSFYSKKSEFDRQLFIQSQVPQYILGIIDKWSGGKARMAGRARKALAMGDKIVNTFGHFTENEWIFDSPFVRRFWSTIQDEVLNVRIDDIDWHEYMHLVCYGMRKFCFGNPLAELPVKQSISGDVLQRSTLWRLDERDEFPRRCRGRDLRWVWKGVDMDYTVPSADRLETRVLNKVNHQPKDRREAITILRSLECRFSHSTVRFFGYTLQKLFSSMFERVDVNEDVLKRIKHLQLARPDIPILLIPTHRSYIDFLMLSYVLFAYHIKVPFIVAGDEFKKIPGVNSILRNSGAFFMKRKLDTKNDSLYVAIFKAYFQQVIKDHKMVEFFVEGTRSRTGFTSANKNGLLSYALELVDNNEVEDMFIVPVSMTFERVMEAETFPTELLGGKKVKESLSRILQAVSVLKTKYGRANIFFDTPVSVSELLARKKSVDDIGRFVTERLNANLTIMASHAVATVLLANRHTSMSTEEVVSQVEILRDFLRNSNVPCILPPQGTCAYSVSKALNKHLTGSAKIRNDRITVNEGEQGVFLLAYYRNQLLGTLAKHATVLSILRSIGVSSRSKLAKEVQAVADLLGPPFRTAIEETKTVIDALLDAQLITKKGNDSIQINPDNAVIANILMSLALPFFDSLWATLNVLRNDGNSAAHNVIGTAVQKFIASAIEASDITYVESSSLGAIKGHIHAFLKRGHGNEGLDALIRRVARIRTPLMQDDLFLNKPVQVLSRI
jgi:fatty acyl-CoA reductase